METLSLFIQTNVEYAPYLIFGVLLLAGFNVPVSEDGMLLITALLAKQYPAQLVPLFLAVYLGAYFSDLICYGLGRLFGTKLLQIRLFKNMVSAQRLAKIHAYYERYGIVTLILGRFIPFGVRNGLFLSAGLGQMSFIKFALSDWLACTLSTLTFFSLYHQYGEQVVGYVMQANLVVFGLALGVAGFLWLGFKRKRGKS